MSEALSANTQAILLLTAPLLVGRGQHSDEILTPAEYKKLAVHLRRMGRQPADLLSGGAPLLSECLGGSGRARVERLLARGFLLSQAVERWRTKAIWVTSRADPAYPQKLKERLKEDAPAVLYGCGRSDLLDGGGLAVVGSRKADDDALAFAGHIGHAAAKTGRTIISGAAKGIDHTAMHGALDEGGCAIGVLADSLERAALSRENRAPLMQGRLVLLSPYDPGAGFSVGHAMQRNKVIYALSDAALVVTAELEKGGTWAGAAEQLDKRHLVPVYVRRGTQDVALDALQRKGALPWPDQPGEQAVLTVLTKEPPARSAEPMQPDLWSGHCPGAERDVVRESLAQPVTKDEVAPAEALFGKVCDLAPEICTTPHSAQQFAVALGVPKSLAEQWLRRLIAEGILVKTRRPVRYVGKTVARGP